jgi:type IV pilus assembly protein PilA
VLTAIQKRLAHDDERGFTLIELMVVVLIIAILIAIAIPTFLGARDRAQDRSAQSDLRNALTAAKTVYSENQTYGTSASLATALEAAAPELGYQTGAATGKSGTPPQREISVAVGPVGTSAGQKVQLVVKSETGTCFALTDTAQGTGAGTSGPTSQASCTATAA